MSFGAQPSKSKGSYTLSLSPSSGERKQAGSWDLNPPYWETHTLLFSFLSEGSEH